MASNKMGEGSGHATRGAGQFELVLKGAGGKAELLMSSKAARVRIDRRCQAKTGKQEETANRQRDATTTCEWEAFQGRDSLHEEMGAVKYRLSKSASRSASPPEGRGVAGRDSRSGCGLLMG